MTLRDFIAERVAATNLTAGPKSRQEIFNEVAEHLLKQGKQARGIHGCQYRGVDDTKCAVGCLITDEAYSHIYEGLGVQSLIYSPSKTRELRAALTYSRIPTDTPDDVLFLHGLQGIHDKRDPKEWPEELREFAAQWKLGLPRCLQ